MKRWCLDRLRGDDNTQPPTYDLTLATSAPSSGSAASADNQTPSRQRTGQPQQPPWVDDRFGSMGGPLRFNSIFTRLFQPFMSGIFYSQVPHFPRSAGLTGTCAVIARRPYQMDRVMFRGISACLICMPYMCMPTCVPHM